MGEWLNLERRCGDHLLSFLPAGESKMGEIVTNALLILVLLTALLLWEAPGILAMLTLGLFTVLVSLAERISGAPPGSYLRAVEDELSTSRQLREPAEEGDDDD